MSYNLYKVSKVNWAVKTHKDEEIHSFENIEAAATYLESIGVPTDEIDFALIDMLAKGTTRAQFGIDKGLFLFSDNARPDGILGVA